MFLNLDDAGRLITCHKDYDHSTNGVFEEATNDYRLVFIPALNLLYDLIMIARRNETSNTQP